MWTALQHCGPDHLGLRSKERPRKGGEKCRENDGEKAFPPREGGARGGGNLILQCGQKYGLPSNTVALITLGCIRECGAKVEERR